MTGPDRKGPDQEGPDHDDPDRQAEGRQASGGEGAAPTAPRAAAPLWMRALLVVSLALNLLVVGVVVGAVAGRRDGPRAEGPREAGSVYLRALPREERARIEAELARTLPPRAERRADFRREMAATLALLRAEPFDAAAFAARLAAQRARLSERARRGDALFVERLAGAAPDERRAYADRLERMLARGLRDGGRP